MKRDESAPPVGATRDDTREQRTLEAVIAQYITDLARAA